MRCIAAATGDIGPGDDILQGGFDSLNTWENIVKRREGYTQFNMVLAKSIFTVRRTSALPSPNSWIACYDANPR